MISGRVSARVYASNACTTRSEDVDVLRHPSWSLSRKFPTISDYLPEYTRGTVCNVSVLRSSTVIFVQTPIGPGGASVSTKLQVYN